MLHSGRHSSSGAHRSFDLADLFTPHNRSLQAKMDQAVRARGEERGGRNGTGDETSSFDGDSELAGGSRHWPHAPADHHLSARASSH